MSWRQDFAGPFTAMNGFPVVIRTLDPPLHEFLPKREDLMVDVAILPYADIPIARLAAAQAAILATRRKRSGRRRIPGEMAWVGGENGCPPPGTKNARVPRWPLAFFSRPDISSILGKNAKPAIRQEVRRPGEDCSALVHRLSWSVADTLSSPSRANCGRPKTLFSYKIANHLPTARCG